MLPRQNDARKPFEKVKNQPPGGGFQEGKLVMITFFDLIHIPTDQSTQH